MEKHESQKDYSHGFGGKFGVQEDRKDASAVGWDYVEKPQHHESQVDHKIVCIFMSLHMHTLFHFKFNEFYRFVYFMTIIYIYIIDYSFSIDYHVVQ